MTITLDDIRAAQHVFWQEFTAEDATRTWEPTIANDDAFGQEIDRRICEKLGITDAVFLAELRRRAQVTLSGIRRLARSSRKCSRP